MLILSEENLTPLIYRDKKREKQRQKTLSAKQEQQKVAKEQEKEQKAERAAKQAKIMEPERRLPADKRRKIAAREEFDELEHDYALFRKLKKKKISEADFFEGIEAGEDI